MKRYFSIIFFVLSTFYFSQSKMNENCDFKINYTVDSIQNTKAIEFKFKNTSHYAVKVPKKLNKIFLQILSLEVYNEKSNSYEKINYKSPEYDFLGGYKGKKVKVLSNKEMKYKFCVFEVNDLVEITSKNKLYRMKLYLNLNEFIDCHFFTDWIYFER